MSRERFLEIFDVIGHAGLEKFLQELEKIDASDPTAKAVLSIVLNAISEHGEAGLDIAKQAIKDLFSGNSIPDPSLLSLEEASDVWASVQIEEADHLDKANAYAAVVISLLSKLFAEFVKGFIGR